MQMFELLEAYNYYPKEEFEILSINVDAGENLVQIQQFIEEYKRYGYELKWVFGNDDDGSIWETYKVGGGGIPAIVIFDKKGDIVFAHEGIAVFTEIPEGLPASTPKLSLIINQLL